MPLFRGLFPGCGDRLFVRHHREQNPPGPGRDTVFATAVGLANPKLAGLLRLDIETQAAAFIHDLAADAGRPVDVHQHQLVAGIEV